MFYHIFFSNLNIKLLTSNADIQRYYWFAFSALSVSVMGNFLSADHTWRVDANGIGWSSNCFLIILKVFGSMFTCVVQTLVIGHLLPQLHLYIYNFVSFAQFHPTLMIYQIKMC